LGGHGPSRRGNDADGAVPDYAADTRVIRAIAARFGRLATSGTMVT
jgi:hypothetical protein